MKNISSIVKKYEEKRKNIIPLVASENRCSDFCRDFLISDIAHRYYVAPAEDGCATWDYPEQSLFKELIELTKQLVSDVFGGNNSSLSALSGNQCVAGILLGTVKQGDCVLGIAENQGGHWAFREISKKIGVNVVSIPVDETNIEIDLNRLKEVIHKNKPKIIMLDASQTLFPFDVERIRSEIDDKIKIFYDVSHTFGLIAGGALKNPLQYGADCIHGSTQKGLLIFNGPMEIYCDIEKSLHPILASNIHLHHIAALAAALEEMKIYGREYASCVVKNAKLLARCLEENGIDIPFKERGYTDTHQVWIPLKNKDIALSKFKLLQEVGISLNLIDLPFGLDIGFRLGTAEITRLNYSDSDIEQLAQIIADIILDRYSIKDIRSKVIKITNKNSKLFYVCN